MLREDDRIIAVYKFGDPETGGIPGPPALAGSARVGFNDVLFDTDETVRRGLLFQDDGESEVESAFSLLIALKALATEGIHPAPDSTEPSWLALGPATLRPFESNDGGYIRADAGGYQMLVDFAAGKEGFQRYRLGALLRGEIAPVTFRDRIVLIGSNARSLPDTFEIPLGGQIPGVELHAHLANQLVRYARGLSAPIAVPGPGSEIGCILLAAILGASLASGLRGNTLWSVSVSLIVVLGGAALLIAAAAAAFRISWWLPVVGVELSWLGSAGIVTAWLSRSEREERAQLMRLFTRHVSPSVAEEIWRRRNEFLLDGRPQPLDLPVTVLFVDMKGYSAQAEKMNPSQLLMWVSEFLEGMAREVERRNGVVEDYFGDGFKANFGIPIPRESPEEIAEDARQAVDSALAMASTLTEINRGYLERGLPRCAMRVGIHSDRAVAGSIGSADHLKYSVVGDVVVTAARLGNTTSIAHDFERAPCRIIISDRTLALVRDRFETQPVGELALKGKEEAVEGYRVLRARDPL